MCVYKCFIERAAESEGCRIGVGAVYSGKRIFSKRKCKTTEKKDWKNWHAFSFKMNFDWVEQILNFVDPSCCTCGEHRKWQRWERIFQMFCGSLKMCFFHCAHTIITAHCYLPKRARSKFFLILFSTKVLFNCYSVLRLNYETTQVCLDKESPVFSSTFVIPQFIDKCTRRKQISLSYLFPSIQFIFFWSKLCDQFLR